MYFSTLVNNEAKSNITDIRIVNPTSDYEQTLKCKWPNLTPKTYSKVIFKQ